MLTALLIAGVTYIVIKAVQKAVEEGTRRGRADEPRPLPVTRRTTNAPTNRYSVVSVLIYVMTTGSPVDDADSNVTVC
jgi:hypothetical protein